MEPVFTEIDERWIAEWVTFGMLELERYLGKHRSFEDYCIRRGRSVPEAMRAPRFANSGSLNAKNSLNS